VPATDTIVAIATPPGAGGVGIVRVSGPSARPIGEALCGRTLRARHAHHARFRDGDGAIIDDGLALLFPAPASYTGEDVLELQAHGSPPVLQQLVARCVAQGARMARPGEFSERAYLNGRLDLAQAEAVADLIAASDLRAARAARRALDGEFSTRVDALADALLVARDRDRAAGHTTVGPHRADWRLGFAGKPTGEALSRGQAKLAALGCLMTQAEDCAAARDGDWPVVLLDDLASELDRDHQARMLAFLRERQAQVFITGTEPPPHWPVAGMTVFHVEHGAIARSGAGVAGPAAGAEML